MPNYIQSNRATSKYLDTELIYDTPFIGYIVFIIFTKHNEIYTEYCFSEDSVQHDEKFNSKVRVSYADRLSDGWKYAVSEIGPMSMYKIPSLEYMNYISKQFMYLQ